jgi:hypothetical protein
LTNAIIDNSTLTAVERVLGRVPVNVSYDLSGDLSAFEAYLSALLFYDNPSRVDDYKAEHAASRTDFFNELGTIKFEKDSYDSLLAESRELASDIYLKIHGGDLSDNMMSDFLKNLDLFVCPAWHMQSSDFYLRIRLLSDGSKGGIDKYSPLMAAIFDQLSENGKTREKINWKKELIGSDGKSIQDDPGTNSRSRKISSDINAFSAGLNWLSLRSLFYALCSEHLQSTAITHPIRNDFLAQFYTKKLNVMRPDQRAAVLAYFRSTATTIIGSSNELLAGPAFKLRTPLISAWAVSVAGSPNAARNLVLEERFSPEAIALRARMRDIEDLHQEGNPAAARQEAANLFRDFEAAVSSFFRKYAKKGEDPYGISANIISLSGSFKALPALDRLRSLLPHRRRSVSLLRNITLDLLQSPTLGAVADLLRSDARCEDETRSSYQPKVDHPRFRYSRSYWKEPM